MADFWSTTGYTISNITSLPSQATFVISPEQGTSLFASSFTYNAPSASDPETTEEIYINNVSFSNNGTPGAIDNTVTVTVDFDQDFVLTQDISEILDISYYPTPSYYSANFSVYGQFIQNSSCSGSAVTEEVDVTVVSIPDPSFTSYGTISNYNQTLSGHNFSVNVPYSYSSSPPDTYLFDVIYKAPQGKYFDVGSTIDAESGFFNLSGSFDYPSGLYEEAQLEITSQQSNINNKLTEHRISASHPGVSLDDVLAYQPENYDAIYSYDLGTQIPCLKPFRCDFDGVSQANYGTGAYIQSILIVNDFGTSYEITVDDPNGFLNNVTGHEGHISFDMDQSASSATFTATITISVAPGTPGAPSGGLSDTISIIKEGFTTVTAQVKDGNQVLGVTEHNEVFSTNYGFSSSGGQGTIKYTFPEDVDLSEMLGTVENPNISISLVEGGPDDDVPTFVSFSALSPNQSTSNQLLIVFNLPTSDNSSQRTWLFSFINNFQYITPEVYISQQSGFSIEANNFEFVVLDGSDYKLASSFQIDQGQDYTKDHPLAFTPEGNSSSATDKNIIYASIPAADAAYVQANAFELGFSFDSMIDVYALNTYTTLTNYGEIIDSVTVVYLPQASGTITDAFGNTAYHPSGEIMVPNIKIEIGINENNSVNFAEGKGWIWSNDNLALKGRNPLYNLNQSEGENYYQQTIYPRTKGRIDYAVFHQNEYFLGGGSSDIHTASIPIYYSDKYSAKVIRYKDAIVENGNVVLSDWIYPATVDDYPDFLISTAFYDSGAFDENTGKTIKYNNLKQGSFTIQYVPWSNYNPDNLAGTLNSGYGLLPKLLEIGVVSDCVQGATGGAQSYGELLGDPALVGFPAQDWPGSASSNNPGPYPDESDRITITLAPSSQYDSSGGNIVHWVWPRGVIFKTAQEVDSFTDSDISNAYIDSGITSTSLPISAQSIPYAVSQIDDSYLFGGNSGSIIASSYRPSSGGGGSYLTKLNRIFTSNLYPNVENGYRAITIDLGKFVQKATNNLGIASGGEDKRVTIPFAYNPESGSPKFIRMAADNYDSDSQNGSSAHNVNLSDLGNTTTGVAFNAPNNTVILNPGSYSNDHYNSSNSVVDRIEIKTHPNVGLGFIDINLNHDADSSNDVEHSITKNIYLYIGSGEHVEGFENVPFEDWVGGLKTKQEQFILELRFKGNTILNG